jgi:hypothetical protein
MNCIVMIATNTGTTTNGVSASSASATPTSVVARPRYIGLRVKRYGPSTTIAVDGVNGLSGVPRRRKRIAAVNPTPNPATISAMPAQRSAATCQLTMGRKRASTIIAVTARTNQTGG